MSNSPASRRTSRAARLAIAELLLAPGQPLDPAAWRGLLSKDVHLRIAGRPVVIGRDAALAELAPLFCNVLFFAGEFFHLWPAPDAATLMVETDLVSSSTKATLPVAIALRVAPDGATIADLRFYLDPTPFSWSKLERSPF